MANGIPPLLNTAANVSNVVALLRADFQRVFGTKKFDWGIFAHGTTNRVIFPDSVNSVEFRNESRLSEYPVENGGFQQYNKVSTPFNTRVRMTKGGSQAARQDFLDTIQKIAASLALYDVVTPEKTYMNANITGYDYSRRDAEGAGLITLDILLIEVRITAVTRFGNTKTASGASPTNAGTLAAAPFLSGGT